MNLDSGILNNRDFWWSVQEDWKSLYLGDGINLEGPGCIDCLSLQRLLRTNGHVNHAAKEGRSVWEKGRG